MFLSKIRAQGEIDDRSPWGDFWFEPVTVRTASGMRVNSETALKLTAVYACVRVLAETMASLPFCLYRRKQNGGKERLTDHWLYKLLAKRPNRWQNAFEWREMMQGHLALRGNGYNRIIDGAGGEIAELLPIHPDRVKIDLFDSGRYVYRVRQRDGTDEILQSDQIFKLCGLSSNGLMGLSPLEIMRESIGEGLAQQDFSSRFFSNDARPMGGWIEFPGSFKDKDARGAWRESWQQSQAGQNRGKTAVLENGMKYHEIGLNNKDSQFVEARTTKVTDIARGFRIPPHLIGDLSRSTNNNIEQQSLEFVTYTMTPWAERWEAAIEDQLLLESEELEVEFEFANLLRGDQKGRAEYYASGVTTGWLTRNEARLAENLDPLPELDEPLQPLNMVPAGEEPDPAPEKTPAKDAPAEDGEGEDGTNSSGAAVYIDARGADVDAVARLEAGLKRLNGSDARARLTAAECIVLKEVKNARNIFRKKDPEQALRAFYFDHPAFMREKIGCSEEFAQAWCSERARKIIGCVDVESELEAWEVNAAAELAARVNADVRTKGSA